MQLQIQLKLQFEYTTAPAISVLTIGGITVHRGGACASWWVQQDHTIFIGSQSDMKGKCTKSEPGLITISRTSTSTLSIATTVTIKITIRICLRTGNFGAKYKRGDYGAMGR